jgi:[acyl-carrier-protein] S-malonyltransferase
MKTPLYANATARVYENPAALVARQINSPVLWRETIENMVADGFDTFIEAGPGKTLAGLIKKINKDVKTFSVSDPASLEGIC